LTLRILLIAATLTLITGYFDTTPLKWVEGASIYFAVALIALFTTSCDYLKSKQYLKLYDAIRDEEVSVVRGQYGLSQPVKVFNLVVGDIILIEAGMRIPADCVLLESMDLTLDESMYFEDRETVSFKNTSQGPDQHIAVNPDILLLARSLVLTGSGRAVVAAVGKQTRINGKMEQEELQQDETPTPLQERLEKMVSVLSKIGYICGFAIFFGMTLWLVCRIMFSEDAQMLSMDTLMKILRIFTITVAVSMVAVPEGLPLAISISMAFSIDVMKKDNLLVKKMEACESLGQIREICTGKTATLTENKMTVNRFYAAQRTIVADNSHSLESLNEGVAQIIKDCIIINNSSRIEMSDDAIYVPEGNGTEVAMLKFL
jgi:Ca2+ transporting ATPase